MSGSSRRSSSSERSSDRQAKANKSAKGKGGAGKTGGADPCNIDFEIDLESVQREALAKTKVGAKLDVAIVRSGAYEAVVCRLPPQTVVGTLAGFPGLATLINCIKQGNNYSATIRSIERGSCTVAVRRT
jgi:hypothetical protein